MHSIIIAITNADSVIAQSAGECFLNTISFVHSVNNYCVEMLTDKDINENPQKVDALLQFIKTSCHKMNNTSTSRVVVYGCGDDKVITALNKFYSALSNTIESHINLVFFVDCDTERLPFSLEFKSEFIPSGVCPYANTNTGKRIQLQDMVVHKSTKDENNQSYAQPILYIGCHDASKFGVFTKFLTEKLQTLYRLDGYSYERFAHEAITEGMRSYDEKCGIIVYQSNKPINIHKSPKMAFVIQ